MKKWLFFIFMLFCVFLVFLIYTNKNSTSIPEEQGSFEVYFCPQDNCEQELLERISGAQSSIHCAFFDLNIPSIINALSQSKADVKVVIDKDNDNNLHSTYAFIKTDTRSAYMHDKFCIFDDREVFTGSMNPTTTDAGKNNNNILFIESRYLAENYEDEFNALWNNNFGSDAGVQYPKISINGTVVENYFCPEDDCEDHIADILNNAHSSIYFMQFSFTSDLLGNILLQKTKTLSVAGIFEKSQNGEYSEYAKLQNVSVLDNSSGLLHHKVFIIDNDTVITGSMNPSRNGNENNDENILIIHNKEIAELYMKEFQRLE